MMDVNDVPNRDKEFTPSRLEELMLELKGLQQEQADRDRRRNRLLAWALAWSFLLPALLGGGYLFLTSQTAEVDTTADPVEVDTRPPAPSCYEIGNWILSTYDNPDDWKLGDPLAVAPEGLRDYERVCIIKVVAQGEYELDTQVSGCSDRNGSMARGGSGDRDGMEMCLAILRANYLP